LTSSEQLLVLDLSVCRWHIHINVGADRQGPIERRTAVALKMPTRAARRCAIIDFTITTTSNTSVVSTLHLSFVVVYSILSACLSRMS